MLKLMISFASLVALFVLPAMVGGNMAIAEEGVVVREVAMGPDYCHIKYEAFKVETLGNPEPEFNSDDLIDFYGSCSLNPRSKDEVQRQLADASREWMAEGDSSGSD